MVNVGQVVARGMIESKTEGSIVNISSVCDRMALEGVGVYCSSKAAVTMLTKSMAVELGVHNIRVNCVCPGLMNTNMVFKDASQSQLTGIAASSFNRNVIKRLIEPSETAYLVGFLLSPLAAMITGSDFVIDGGLSAS